jgi:hypothetical protein
MLIFSLNNIGTFIVSLLWFLKQKHAMWLPTTKYNRWIIYFELTYFFLSDPLHAPQTGKAYCAAGRQSGGVVRMAWKGFEAVQMKGEKLRG